MLIRALCDYYDMLAENNKILPEGYSKVPIHYLVVLTADGKIDGFVDYRDKIKETVKGKEKERYVPKEILMPERTQKSKIDSNVIEHRPLYIFGLNMIGESLTRENSTEKAKKSHAAFVDFHLKFLEGLHSPLIEAFRNFLKTWIPEQETENVHLLSLGKDFSKSGYAFCLSGYPDFLLHEEPKIREKWSQLMQERSSSTDSYMGQCAIYGNKVPIARIHGKIKGIYGGASTGSTLIGFNNESEKSYHTEQSYNSNISETAMKKYTEALNYLLSSSKHKTSLGDTTIVFWAMSPNESAEKDFMSMLMMSYSDKDEAQQTEDMILDILKKGKLVILQEENMQNVDELQNVDFYIVGLKPNVARVSMQFLYRKRYADVLWNIAKFQSDVKIDEAMYPVSLYRIGKELISPKSSSEKVNPALLTKLFEAILYNAPCPTALLENVVRRCKTDKFINNVRAGILKACINRKEKKEEITMGLNKENSNQAYLCGRLFAVLEKIQVDASGGNLNRTIKDSYFASATARPVVVFPQLLKLSQHHLKKIDYSVFYNKLIGEIMEKLNNEFPEILLLQDQGRFLIGYYQQNQDFYKSTKKENKKENESEEMEYGN